MDYFSRVVEQDYSIINFLFRSVNRVIVYLNNHDGLEYSIRRRGKILRTTPIYCTCVA
jgi:hypothetical protein